MRDGWKALPLSDVIEHTIGGVWGGESDTDEVEVTVVRSTEFTKRGYLDFGTGVSRSIKHSQLKSRELKEGDILLEKSGGGPDQPVGRVVYVTAEIPNKFVCSNFVQLVRPNSMIIEPLLLFHIMWQWHAINRTLGFQAQTTGIRNLRTPDYLDQEIYLPPLPEQKRIVDLISSVDSYIEALQQQLMSAKKSRNAVLHELLSSGGDDWITAKLGEVTDLITDGSHYSPKTTDHGVPYVTVRDLKDGVLDLRNSARISEDSYLELEKNGCRPHMNDILFSKDGTVGKVALVLNEERFVVLSSLAIIRSKKKVILPKFLALTMSSSNFQRDAIGSKTGLAIKRIVLKHLRDLQIKVPTISEQQRVIEVVSEIDLVIALCLNTLTESKKLRNGMLSDLLSGKHEIPSSYDKVMGAA